MRLPPPIRCRHSLSPRKSPEQAERDVEHAVLSAMAHGNGSNGLAVVEAALRALRRFDQVHAAAYSRIIEGKRDVLLRSFELRGVALADDVRARILACRDEATLDRWLDGVLRGKVDVELLS